MKNILLLLVISYSFELLAQNWQRIGIEGPNSPVISCIWDEDEEKLHVAGVFTKMDYDTVNGITMWDGVKWNVMGNGVTPGSGLAHLYPISCVKFQNELYYFGRFFAVDNLPFTRGLAKWTGNNWEALSSDSLSGIINCGLVNNNALYVGGAFDISNLNIKKIAKWDGVNWSAAAPNINIGSGQHVYSLAFYKNKLFAGGQFDLDEYDDLAVFDGNQWTDVGGSLKGSGWVNSMVVYKDYLYVAGQFRKSAGNAGNLIMRWDGENWEGVGVEMENAEVVNSNIIELSIIDDKLFAVGQFNNLGGSSGQNIAYYDGENWCGFNTKFPNGVINSVSKFKNSIAIGGNFIKIEEKPIRFLAEWIGGDYLNTCGNTLGFENDLKQTEILIFPNPVAETLTVKTNDQQFLYKIYDSTGRLIKSEKKSDNQINVQSLKPGFYFLSIESESTNITQKFIKE